MMGKLYRRPFCDVRVNGVLIKQLFYFVIQSDVADNGHGNFGVRGGGRVSLMGYKKFNGSSRTRYMIRLLLKTSSLLVECLHSI